MYENINLYAIKIVSQWTLNALLVSGRLFISSLLLRWADRGVVIAFCYTRSIVLDYQLNIFSMVNTFKTPLPAVFSFEELKYNII